MAGRRGVEHDVVVPAGGVRPGEQVGELVERSDLGRTRAGQLFGDRRQIRRGQQITDRSQGTVPVLRSGLLRVDLQRVQTRHDHDVADLVTHRLAEHMADVGRRIGGHQQHPMTPIRQIDRGCARHTGLADPTLAGEEDVAGKIVEEPHRSPPQQPPLGVATCTV